MMEGMVSVVRSIDLNCESTLNSFVFYFGTQTEKGKNTTTNLLTSLNNEL